MSCVWQYEFNTPRLRHEAALAFLLPRRTVAWEGGGELRVFRLAAGGVHHVTADEILALRLGIDVLEILRPASIKPYGCLT
jgi:hypothetical protein